MLCWRSSALRTDGCLTCMPTLGATLGCGPDPGAEHLGQGRARRARAARQPGARARGAPGAAAAAQPAGGRGAIAAQRRRLCPTCGAGLSCAGLLCASEACVCAFCLVALGQHCGNRSAYTRARLGRTQHGRAQQLNPTVCEMQAHEFEHGRARAARAQGRHTECLPTQFRAPPACCTVCALQDPKAKAVHMSGRAVHAFCCQQPSQIRGCI